MGRKKKVDGYVSTPAQESEFATMRPAFTDEAREDQLINLAMDLAEKQMLDGSASSQVIAHYLKLGAMKERNRLELIKLEKETELLKAKAEMYESAKRQEVLYDEVMSFMKRYGSNSDDD